MKEVTIVDTGGESWSKLRRELSEIAALCWLPN
jgi:hypothetical protein